MFSSVIPVPAVLDLSFSEAASSTPFIFVADVKPLSARSPDSRAELI
jgi:hypothetical protein